MSNNVILASASPRRRELLGMIFDKFDIVVSNAEEIVPEGVPVNERPEYLARIKAEDIAVSHPESLVIGADTMVFDGNKILGKPKNQNDAYNMLCSLSGKTHKVITGCAVFKNGNCKSFSVTTEVEFYKLCEDEIRQYISTDEPYDKAGAYGIQSKGGLFVKGIKGDYFNVVGLPVAELSRVIKAFL